MWGYIAVSKGRRRWWEDLELFEEFLRLAVVWREKPVVLSWLGQLT